jgi:glycosyltransferase involved in cell wall biosynthesis
MNVGFDAMLLRTCRSGVELSILRLIQALAEHGRHTYRVYLPAKSEAGRAGGPSTTAYPRLHCRPVRGAACSRPARLAWEQLVLPRRLARDGCAILHAPGYLAPLRGSIPVVLTVYDVMALTHPEWCRPLNRWNYRLLLPRSLARAAAIIVPSAFTAAEIVRIAPATAGKLHVVPLAAATVASRRADPATLAAARRRWKLPEHFVLFVGREEPKKNIAGLIEVFQTLKRTRNLPHELVLVGPPGPSSRSIMRNIRARGLDNLVHRRGFVPHEALPAFYACADAVACLSLYEGFGLPPLEAMAQGTPVVYAAAGALPEVIGQAGLAIRPGDIEAAAQALATALTDTARRSELIARGHARATVVTWADIARQTEAVYDAVLTGVPTPGGPA